MNDSSPDAQTMAAPPPARPEWTITRSARISGVFRVDITVGPGGMCCEWSPDRPKKLTPAQFERYRKVRDEAIAAVAERMGANIAVVDVGANDDEQPVMRVFTAEGASQ